ncbi:MAG: hypothetical protein KJ077_08225 [Anaerolineae bacterium]|nr:hypothetical protein [Anaerolineae bacterium]
MAFPLTSTLDDFNRANGSPGANWSGVVPNFLNTCAISGNRLGSETNDFGAAIFQTQFDANQEVFAEIPVLPDENYAIALIFRCLSPTSAEDCYYLEYKHRSDESLRTLSINKGFSVHVTLGSTIISFSPGDWFGARAVGSTLIAYRKAAGDDRYQEIFRVSDSAYNGEYIGAACLDLGTGRLDNFGGGTVETWGLSEVLFNEMDSLQRTPASQVTVERWLPEWAEQIGGLSGGATEEYGHGHSAAVAPDGSGPSQDIICRARSGSFASPQNGRLYIAVIRDDDFNLDNWETLWVDTGITGLMYPAWTANSGASHGGSIAVVHSGTNFRVFYLKSDGSLCYVDVSYTGVVGTPATIASLGTGAQLASMQIAACTHTEVFVLLNQQVEASLAAWQPVVYGSFIRRYAFSGSWAAYDSFPFHMQAEGGLGRDTPDEGSDFGDTSAARITAQWGKRLCGGLGACQIDAGTVLVSLGLTTWRRWGYDTHSQGLVTFIYHRDSDWWERGAESDLLDFNEDSRLLFAGLARAWQIEGRNFVSWSRFAEPSDYEQTTTSVSLPRLVETVMAKVSADGRFLTQPVRLGNADELSGAAVMAVNTDSLNKWLYIIGWRTVYVSQPAAFLCSVNLPQDLSGEARGWTLRRDNRRGMALDIDLADPSPVIDTNSVAKSGALARAYFGTPDEVVQVGQGFVDINTPELQVSRDGQFGEGAALNCRADEPLLSTRADFTEDILSQNVTVIEEANINQVTIERGSWVGATIGWPDRFFAGTYPGLNGKVVWRLQSFPLSNVEENGDASGGTSELLTGLVTNPAFGRTHLVGSWFKDVMWLNAAPQLDGMIQASVRCGNDNDQGNYYASYNRYGTALYATVTKTNGRVVRIVYSSQDYGGTNFFPNAGDMIQVAAMAGVMMHSPETGRRYAFVWEDNSDFATSSHMGGPWNGELYDEVDYSSPGVGPNRLCLVVFDNNGSSWVAESVAGLAATGLTQGHPADLRMQMAGGTIYCFYRAHSTGTPNQWRFAFSHKAGRFGPGKFGLIGRGHGPVQWSRLEPGLPYIRRLNNWVDFWNIQVSDTARDQTLRDHLQRACWRGFTETEFRSEVSEASRAVTSGSNHNYATPVENLAMDFKLSIGNGVEGGVFVRGVSSVTPLNECIRLGLVASSTANSAGNTVTTYLVKRRYAGGSQVALEYAPLPIRLVPGTPVPVRVTVNGAVYSVWIAGIYAGHFVDTTPLGLYFGLYATGGTATFTGIYVPELYEVVDRLTFEVNQGVDEVLGRAIGNRRVKAVYAAAGELQFSYFSDHDDGPAFDENRLWQSSVRKDGRYYSKIRLEGQNAYAVYQSASLAARGPRFQVVTNQNITQREFAYREARAIVTEQAERQQQATFTGLIDVRINPEDVTEITINRQEISGQFLVDDITMNFEKSEDPKAEMAISVRQSVAL